MSAPTFSAFLLAVSLLATSGPARAADLPAATTIALDALVAETLAKNPELNFYQGEIAAARGGRTTAGAYGNPTLSTSLGAKRVRDNAGVITAGVAYSVSLQQTFEYPGRLALRKAIAGRQIELANLGLDQFRATLAARVRTLGYGLAVEEEKAAAAEGVASRYEALTQALAGRDPAGLTPLLEARIIEAAALTARRRATEAGRAVQSAGAELNLLRGEPPSAPPPRVPRPELRLGPLPPLPTLLAGARERNFEIRSRRVELAQGSLRVKLSRNERLPAVTIAPFFTQERADTREFQSGFNLSVPLPIFDQNQGNIRAAEARRQQADVSLSLAERNVERQLAERLSAYEARRRELGPHPPGQRAAVRGRRRVGRPQLPARGHPGVHLRRVAGQIPGGPDRHPGHPARGTGGSSTD